MRKLLLAVDGSDSALHAAAHVADLAALQPGLTVHVVNVQVPLRGDVAMFVPGDDIEAWHQEQGGRELARVVALLTERAVSHTKTVMVGPVAETIARAVREEGADAVVMGSRGLGALAGIVLGSVATKVIHLVDVPVTLVK
ncbi:MAG: universal stress protein [Ectothiorhodospiraceae bacterium]|nr:universal stress protein [Chromatiales bacterium]MCP5157077.1 universal stress protein [Ectothiorhodospiraceae bacterium]